jgi:tetratricopeptide (TPR) repeat protein
MDITSGRTPSTMPPSASMSPGDVAARDAVPYGAPELHEAAPVMSPDAASGATAAQADGTALVKPTNAKVTALIENGKRATLKGDLDRAVRDFSEAIRIDPEYPDSYLERGQALFKLGEIERAIADYSAALVRDPQQGAALRARGMAYLYNSKADLALADLSKTIELAERNPRLLAPIELFYARRSRGAIYDSKQQYDLEIADCTALIETYTHDPRLVEALTANYGNTGAANILATIYRQRANAFIKRSNWERAVADLTEAIPLSSDRGYTALIDRSKLQEGLGRYQSAAADAQAALNIRPGSEEARLALNRLGTPSKPTPPKGL